MSKFKLDFFMLDKNLTFIFTIKTQREIPKKLLKSLTKTNKIG